MQCIKCDVSLSEEELNKRIKCDQCGGNLCQACSGLGATEVRVMQLTGKRRLRLICHVCDGRNDPCLDREALSSEFTCLEKSIKDHYVSCIEALKADFLSELKGLREQVAFLSESNIQLIHLINPSPGQVSAAKTNKPVSAAAPQIGGWLP